MSSPTSYVFGDLILDSDQDSVTFSVEELEELLDSPKERRKYEVFLSFRGDDTRASFISHLTSSLQNAGIIVFKDDQSVPRGFSISTSLQRGIEGSRISIIVFSKNYADSPWCMQELIQILECYRTTGQVVLPVFYDVYPSDVRRQSREFGQSFQHLLNNNVEGDGAALKWIDALHDVAGIAGFVVPNYRLVTSSVHFECFLRDFVFIHLKHKSLCLTWILLKLLE